MLIAQLSDPHVVAHGEEGGEIGETQLASLDEARDPLCRRGAANRRGSRCIAGRTTDW